MPIMMTRGEKFTFSNHLDQSYGEIQGFCTYPEEEGTESIFDVSLSSDVSCICTSTLYEACCCLYSGVSVHAVVETIMHRVGSTATPGKIFRAQTCPLSTGRRATAKIASSNLRLLAWMNDLFRPRGARNILVSNRCNVLP